MSEFAAARKLPKWPFYVADGVLCAVAGYALWRLGVIEGKFEAAVAVGCLAAAAWGAWLAVTPWLVEYRSGVSLADSENLKSALEQIQQVEKVADAIRQANANWQGVQDAATRTVNAAREISDKMKVEADEFMRFLENAHGQERAGLKLEAEKLRRAEGDWVKVVVQILDHVHALTRAAERSGQQNLIAQLVKFQEACRDAARRIGLTPFAPAAADAFDARGHQLPDAEFTPPEGSKIGEVLAAGYTYQGQLLRRALVLLENPPGGGPAQPEGQDELPLGAS